jgi:hypothetical protein
MNWKGDGTKFYWLILRNVIILGCLEGLKKSEKSLGPLRQIFETGVSRIQLFYRKYCMKYVKYKL